MGIDYSVHLGVGFIVNKDSLTSPFRVETEEQFHMEDRFNPKTGEKLAPVKVVDVEADEAFVFEGKTYDDWYELSEALAEKLDCGIQDTGGYTDGETIFVTLAVDTDDGGTDEGRFTVGGAAKFDDVTAMRAQLTKLKKAFKKFGVDLGEAKVFPAWNVS